MAVLKKIKFGKEAATPIQFTEVKTASGGVITASGTHTDLEDGKNPEYVIDLNVAGDGTLLKENGALKVGTVPAAQVSVDKTNAGIDATDAQSAFKELKDAIGKVDADAKSYTIVKETESLESNVKEQYKLQETVGETTKTVGETIKIYKDSSLKSVELDGQELVFTYILNTGAENVVRVDVSTFLAESEFADGLQVTDHVVSVKTGNGLGINKTSKAVEVVIDPTSERFLTVGANGVKLAGVQDAINAKVAALDKTDDAAVAGQYVAAIEETDGVVAVKARANVSDAVLTGYAKGSAPASGSEAVTASDDVKGAIAKLEHQVDAAKAAASAAHSKVAEAQGNTHVTVTTSQPDANGAITYTIGEKNIADADDLAAEIVRAQAAEGEIASKVGLTSAEGSRTFTPTTNYGGAGTESVATSVMDNMQKIDTALKAVSDKLDGVQYKIDGTTLEFFGIEPKSSNP